MALNSNLPLLSSSKNHSHYACHAHQRPTHSQYHEHDRVSDFVPIASLLEWQWHRETVNFTTLLETELVGLPKSHTHSQSHFTKCCKRGWVIPPPTPLPTHRFHQKLDQVQQILERPSEGGRLRPSADTELS